MVRRLAHTMVAYVRNMEYGIYEMANSRFEYRLLLDEGFCRTPKELEEQRQKRKEQQSMEAFAKMLTQKLNIVSTKNAVTVSAASDQSVRWNLMLSAGFLNLFAVSKFLTFFKYNLMERKQASKMLSYIKHRKHPLC